MPSHMLSSCGALLWAHCALWAKSCMAMHQPCHVIISQCSQRQLKKTSDHSIDNCSDFLHDRWGWSASIEVEGLKSKPSKTKLLPRHDLISRLQARRKNPSRFSMRFWESSSLYSFLGGSKTQTLNQWTCLHNVCTMRHYVLASCRTRRNPASESCLRIHSTCKKLKQSKKLKMTMMTIDNWQLTSQVTCWDFLGWTKSQVQGKETNQKQHKQPPSLCTMVQTGDTKMKTEMSGTNSGQDSWAKPWRSLWTPLQWAPRRPKAASNCKLPIESNWKVESCSMLLGYCYFFWNLVLVCDMVCDVACKVIEWMGNDAWIIRPCHVHIMSVW